MLVITLSLTSKDTPYGRLAVSLSNSAHAGGIAPPTMLFRRCKAVIDGIALHSAGSTPDKPVVDGGTQVDKGSGDAE